MMMIPEVGNRSCPDADQDDRPSPPPPDEDPQHPGHESLGVGCGLVLRVGCWLFFFVLIEVDDDHNDDEVSILRLLDDAVPILERPRGRVLEETPLVVASTERER